MPPQPEDRSIIRTITTLGVLLLVGRGFLIDHGVPVDKAIGPVYETASAPFDWDRYDLAAMGTSALLAFHLWRKRPHWARLISRRRERKLHEQMAYIYGKDDPHAEFLGKANAKANAAYDKIVKAMRAGQSYCHVPKHSGTYETFLKDRLSGLTGVTFSDASGHRLKVDWGKAHDNVTCDEGPKSQYATAAGAKSPY